MSNKPVAIDTKTIYEVLPDLPARKTRCICKRCNKKMQVLGEVNRFMWMDYFDGSGGEIDLCKPCADFMVKEMKKIIGRVK